MSRPRTRWTPTRGELLLLASALALTGFSLTVAAMDPSAWARLGREDGFVEGATAVALLVFSAVAAARLRRGPAGERAPSLVAVLVGLFAAGEEVSWGQRWLGLEPPAFFADHNVQGEMNVHNLLPPPWDGVLAGVLILGFCFSPLLRDRTWARKLAGWGLPWPRAIHVGVLAGCLAAALVVALVTGAGDVEELAELVCVLTAAAVWSSRPARRSATG